MTEQRRPAPADQGLARRADVAIQPSTLVTRGLELLSKLAEQPVPSSRNLVFVRPILLLANDRPMNELLLHLLRNVGGYDVVFASAHDEARILLRAHDFSLVIVTNIGLSPWESVALVPEDHAYPAFFLSGFWNRDIEAACSAKRLHCIPLPFEPEALLREIQTALGRPTDRQQSR